MRKYFVIVLATCLLIECAAFAALLATRLNAGTTLPAASGDLLRLHPWLQTRVAYGVYDPLLTQRYAPNSRTGVLSINQHGFIGNGTTDPALTVFPQKPPGLVRIVLLGGSSLAGNALRSDNTQTIPAFLERILNDAAPHGTTYQALNYGISDGWSFSELRRFFAEIIHIKPDIVISLDGWNDAVRAGFEADRNHVEQGLLNWDQLSYLYFELINGIPRDQFRPPPIFTFTALVLHRVGLLDAARDAHRDRLYEDHHLTALSRHLSEDHDGLHFAFIRNLEAISAYAAWNGFAHIAYLQPYAEHKRPVIAEEQAALDAHHIIAAAQNGSLWERDTYRRLMAEIYARYETAFRSYAAKYATEDRIRVHDLTGLFAGEEAVLYLDSIHYNELGNQLIAERMATDVRSLLERVTLNPRPPRGPAD